MTETTPTGSRTTMLTLPLADGISSPVTMCAAAAAAWAMPPV
jgi:hypothetical protein